MPTVQEQAMSWLRAQKSRQDDPAFFAAACALVPPIPLSPVGMPYGPACESVLCGAWPLPQARHCSLFAAALSKRQGRYGRILRGLVPGIERRGDGATHE